MDKFYFAVESQSTVTVAEALQAVSSASPLPSHLKDFALLMSVEDSHSSDKRDLLASDFMGLALVDKHNQMEVLRTGSTAKMITLKDENVRLNGRCLHLEESVEKCKSLVALIKRQRDELDRQLSSALEDNGSLRTEIRTLREELDERRRNGGIDIHALNNKLDSQGNSIASTRNEAAVASSEN